MNVQYLTTQTGFKEWAAIVEALGTGRQSLILRKGGIVEEGGEFQPDHKVFLLIPTYWHQQPEGLKKTEPIFLSASELHRPPEDQFVVRHAAVVIQSRPVRSIEGLRRLNPFHIWSEAVVEERFHRWQSDVVHAMLVRIFRLNHDLTIPILPEHRGCKSWVHLDEVVSLENAKPVIEDDEFNGQSECIARALIG